MYEIICPACRRMVEVPAQVAVVGAQCKCPKCWTILEVVTDHPLRLAASKRPSSNVVRSASSLNKLVRSEPDE
jgi:phage FluMu protein Com